MTKKDQKTEKAPTFFAYHVPDRDNAPWIKIGAAWDHADDKGLNLMIDVLPIGFSGRIVLRAPSPKQEAGA